MLKCDERTLQRLVSCSLEAEPEAGVWAQEIYWGGDRKEDRALGCGPA